MSKIIFLNGCGSSGKTSVVRGIQHVSNEPWLTFGVDKIIDMLPPTKQSDYYKFIPDSNEHGSTMRVETTKRGIDFFLMATTIAKLIADSGNDLIIDEVVLDDNYLKQYAKALDGHTVYYVGIICDLKTMQEREILRSDRHIGLSADQINRVHNGMRANYDLRVDTSNISPFDAARQILGYIESGAEPKSFENLRNS